MRSSIYIIKKNNRRLLIQFLTRSIFWNILNSELNHLVSNLPTYFIAHNFQFRIPWILKYLQLIIWNCANSLWYVHHKKRKGGKAVYPTIDFSIPDNAIPELTPFDSPWYDWLVIVALLASEQKGVDERCCDAGREEQWRKSKRKPEGKKAGKTQ